MTQKQGRLSKQEVNEFLAQPIVARIGTVKSDGSPHVAAMWQQWDGEAMWVIPRSRSSWFENLKNEPRVCISCADDVNPEHTRVTIEGIASVVEGPTGLIGRVKEIADEMALRYMGPDGPAYAAKTAERLRYLVKVTPTTITSWCGEWHPRYIVTGED
ncbi:MAG: pyridoxamine 5'-phosphate oxidase family protein [Chloroflexi bacterium]|nr:pyridoxamine 5'-phosphate oxidase family protein [Chloroflexota bacterium]